MYRINRRRQSPQSPKEKADRKERRRALCVAILLLAAALLPCFNVLAALVPLLLQRFVLMILSASNKDEQKEAPGHGQ